MLCRVSSTILMPSSVSLMIIVREWNSSVVNSEGNQVVPLHMNETATMRWQYTAAEDTRRSLALPSP